MMKGDSDLMLTSPCPEYYEISKLNKPLNSSDSSRNCLSLFHCNIRSLPKKPACLKRLAILFRKKPDVLLDKLMYSKFQE